MVTVVENNDACTLNSYLNTAILWKALEQRIDITQSLFQKPWKQYER